jgi:putative peptidoglycan lipid II flippase
MVVLAIANSSLNFAITPILITYYKNNNNKALKELANSYLNVLILLFTLLAAIQIIFADSILAVLLPGFSAEKLAITRDFFRLQAIASIFTISSTIFIALNYMQKKYYRTVIFPIVSKIIQIICVLFLNKYFGIYSLIYALVGERIINLLLLCIPYIRYYRFKIVYSKEFKKSITKVLPLILSSSFSKSNIIVDRFFASMLSSGSIALLDYGQKIIKIITSFINKGISIVSLRKFSINENNGNAFNSMFNRVYSVMIFIIIPVTFAIVFFLEDALDIIVHSNKISSGDIRQISLISIAFLGSFIGGSLTGTISNAFYSKGLTKIISKVNIVIQTLSIILKIGLFYIIGFLGLPVGFSIMSIVNSITLLYLYNKKIYKIKIKFIFMYFIRIVMISVVAMILPYFLNSFFKGITITLISGIIFFIIYFGISLVFEKDVSKSIFMKINVL